MELTAIFFSLAVLILVGIYLYAPFMERRARRVTEEEHELSALMAERDRVINSLQELDFDFKLGKIPEDDYPVQRSSLLQKGADILRKIDSASPPQDGLRHRIQKRDWNEPLPPAAPTPPCQSGGERRRSRIDDLPRAARAAPASLAGFCPKCGKPVMVTDRFCPSCGKSLA